MNKTEQTLSIIKPDAVERNLDNEIKEIFKNKGFSIVKEKKIQIEKSEAEKFYKVHETKPFYNDLCAYLSSGPIVVMVLEKENSILGNRELMGATNPKDAEGRLVLADALTFTEKKFKPEFMVDLATLTGAIIVSLGSEYAGLFSNDDKLSNQLLKAGEKVDEKLWRMPLHKNFDKLINSKNADMQNINYVGGAGSTTAAQFLQRFILNKTPWAHLDIAGMAFSKYGGALNSGGATGYGVRLLNKLIEDDYE